VCSVVLFGDDGFEKEREFLKRRIVHETRAVELLEMKSHSPLQPIFDSLEKQFPTPCSSKETNEPMESDENRKYKVIEFKTTYKGQRSTNEVASNTLCRWKFAFRDTSKLHSNNINRQRKLYNAWISNLRLVHGSG
jgi:hypothetical protein